MRATQITGAALATLGVALALSASAGAELIGLYRNPMETTSQRADPVKLFGARCQGGGATHVFRIVIGKQTKECSYRTPVIGRDLQVAATMRVLAQTPKSLQSKVFLALNLRAGGGSRYQLAVFPKQGKTQLRKVFTDGSVKYLQIEKEVPTVKGIGKANELRLRAFNITAGPEKGSCRVLAFVGGEQVGDFRDTAAGELKGRASGFAVGAANAAKGAAASVDNVTVRGPNPF